MLSILYSEGLFCTPMELTLSTPALLFPAISLLLLAYTSRFLALAALMRDSVCALSQRSRPQDQGAAEESALPHHHYP